MKKSTELKQDLAGLKKDYESKLDQISDINKKAEEEKRSLTSDEQEKVNKLFNEVESFNYEEKRSNLEKELNKALTLEKHEEKRAAASNGAGSGNQGNAGFAFEDVNDSDRKAKAKLLARVNVAEALGNFMRNQSFEGANAEIHKEAEEELKRFGKTPSGFAIPEFALHKRTDIDQNTSSIQPTSLDSYVDAIRAYAVYLKVGITPTPATGDVKTPIVTAQNFAWASAENTAATDIGANMTSKTATPKWLRGYVNVSKTLLNQNGDQAMSAIMRDLARAEVNNIDTALFSTSSVSNAPTSIAATSGVLTFVEASYSANASVFSDFVEAVQTLAENDAMTDMIRYVAAPILYSEVRKSAQIASVNPGMIGDNFFAHIVNGFPVHFTTAATNATTTGDVVAGDFGSGVRMYTWGGTDFTVDPYSRLLEDQVRVVCHKHIDWVVPQGARFVKFTSPVQ